MEKSRTDYFQLLFLTSSIVCVSQIVYVAVKPGEATRIGPLLQAGSDAQTSVGSSVELLYRTQRTAQKMSIARLEWIHDGCPR